MLKYILKYKGKEMGKCFHKEHANDIIELIQYHSGDNGAYLTECFTITKINT